MHDPDWLDYCLLRARGEFSFFAYENAEQRITKQGEFFKKFPQLKEKLW
jgi:hypothetical protein